MPSWFWHKIRKFNSTKITLLSRLANKRKFQYITAWQMIVRDDWVWQTLSVYSKTDFMQNLLCCCFFRKVRKINTFKSSRHSRGWRLSAHNTTVTHGHGSVGYLRMTQSFSIAHMKLATYCLRHWAWLWSATSLLHLHFTKKEWWTRRSNGNSPTMYLKDSIFWLRGAAITNYSPLICLLPDRIIWRTTLLKT